ncbi:helix-turn-helix domain-containing protein [Nocardiopsis kunsanensis]|uniref:helix-turn-helix domain-containing protein n=1 Tax=Nocardiopsis kunsanensis TaxID=141693 RepID=UPI000344FB90|nr:helix-turn-helix domain-containing protein [Nocardiopsis kunsanensis]
MLDDPEIPDLLTPEQAGELVGMSKQGVMKLIHADRLPARQVGRQYVLRRSAVADYRETREHL